jgi:stearoyl-CoA desaturase (delta-9 desaturase)
MTKMV